MTKQLTKQIITESTQEDLFLAGMITSKTFIDGVEHVFNPRYFKSPHIKKIAVWVFDYYREFDTAPGSEIQNIFEIEHHNEPVADAELIEALLKKISKTYAGREFNVGYILPKFIDYIRSRVVELALDDAKWNLKKRGPTEAWESLNQITEVRRKTQKSINFFRDFEANFDSWFYANKTELMRFPGALGHYMAPLVRKKLIAFLAPPKRGKTWWLMYTAYLAVTHKLNVAFFSLEMSEEEVQERFAAMVTGVEFGSEKDKNYTIPQMDCVHNQEGTCTNPNWINPGDSIYEDDKVPEYEDAQDHIICNECRRDWNEHDALHKRTDFVYAPWMYEDPIDQKSGSELVKSMRSFPLHFGPDGMRIFTYRIGEASVADIEKDLDQAEQMDGWVPDVVVVDYADITRKNNGIADRRHQLSDIWEQLSGMTKERNVLTFTASQGNRGSSKKANISSDDISEDWGKVMIVDGLIAINEDNVDTARVDKDKYWQTQRLEWLAHRYKKDIREWEQCLTANNLTLGQVCLDSEIINKRG